MAIWDKIFGKARAKEPTEAGSLPTVKFDTSLVTDAVKADLKQNIADLHDVPEKHQAVIYQAALESILGGRQLSHLFDEISRQGIDGMSRGRVSEITHLLNNKATAMISRDQQITLGFTRAKWVWSGSPCAGPSPRQAAEHQAANGKDFALANGLFVDGKWTWPGREDGCKCISRVSAKGFE